MKPQEKIIIATLYSYEPVISSVMKVGADKLFMLIDHSPDNSQSQAVEEVKKAIGKYVGMEIVKTEVYDIAKVAQDAVNLIDQIPRSSQIYLNVSAARKTKSMGLMFAGYARSNRIHQIIYVTKENKKVVILPKFSFRLTKSEREVLTLLNQPNTSLRDAQFKSEISRAQFYKSLKELKAKSLIDDDNKISDAGRIALL